MCVRGEIEVEGCACWTNVIDGMKKGDCATCIRDLRNGCALVDKNSANVLVRLRTHSLLYEYEGRVKIRLAFVLELLVGFLPLCFDLTREWKDKKNSFDWLGDKCEHLWMSYW